MKESAPIILSYLVFDSSQGNGYANLERHLHPVTLYDKQVVIYYPTYSSTGD